ncbi:hypothetical protein ABMA28_017263 [Loxostege sticticalis]|uniref:Uncharacterized protein n=1 Tax=Loxostege sticticalis TaxID=481309 RepID=A0ABD0S1Z1_LOXSC
MCSTSEGCGTDRDRVARRLSLAERERRLDYEREVAARPSTYVRKAPPAPYTLGAERECARATDGRSYAVKCERAPSAPCGPGRTPPPPRCVELVRDTECAIRNNVHLDPCAHVPRTIIDIDRSADRPASTPAAPAYPTSPAPVSASRASSYPTSACPGQSPPTKNLTSRIMEKLSLTRNSPGASCPKSSHEPKCETTGARRAGDTGWCQTQPKPAQVPPCCREPTTMEKIKRRGPGPCSREKRGPSGRRTFHSSACSGRATAPAACGDGGGKKDPDKSVSKGNADAESLKKVLKERDSLQEAGQGRVVTNVGNKSKQNTASGRLDIPIPVGAQNIRVRVSLDGAKATCQASSEPETATVTCSASDGAATKSDKNQSWLSLKSLQQKLAGCVKKDSVKLVKNTKHEGGRTPATCPRPQPQKPKSPAPVNPCAPPAKPRGNPCGAPSHPKPANPCGDQRPPKPTNPCGAPKPSKSTNPCGASTPPKPTNPCGCPSPAVPRSPCAPSAPSSPGRPCPTKGAPNTKKPTRYSTTASDSLIPEILFIQW